jgi:cell division protein FtsN
LTSRDYKGGQPHRLDLHRWRDFGAGLGLGLLAALAVYVGDHRGRKAEVEIKPTKQAGAAIASTTPAAATEDTEFSFYDRLPKFEVVVPEKERSSRVNSSTTIDKAGTYYLQIGSYHDAEEAQRVQAQLARQDITASVQRLQLDSDVWHRVRIGPITDLAALNEMITKLRAADMPMLVLNVSQ